jgi:hypothetical protein
MLIRATAPFLELSMEEEGSSSSRRLYWVCVAVRVALVATPGYIQPDEFFQGPEIGARDIVGAEIYLPWEWGGLLVSPNWPAGCAGAYNVGYGVYLLHRCCAT